MQTNFNTLKLVSINIKSFLCNEVIKLMENNYNKEEALNTIANKYNLVNVTSLKKQLETYK